MSAWVIVLAFFIGIITLLFLITLHELGHFVVAKISKAFVYEFSIGFGPRIYTFKGKETWYSIRMIPLGGYVSIASDHADPPKEREDEIIPNERKMEYIVRWKKAFFILSGPLVNFFFAALIVTSIFASTMQKQNDMTFYGQRFDTNQIAWKLIKKNDENVYQQKYALTGWEVVVLNQNESVPEINSDGYYKGSNNDIYFSNIHELIGKDGVPKPIYDGNGKAHTYKDIVYNFLDEFKKDIYNIDNEKQIGYIRFSYMQFENKYSNKLIGDQLYTDFSDKQGELKFDLKKGTTVGVMAPTRYYENSTIAYGAGWNQVLNDSLSLLKALGMVFTGHFSALSGPFGVANQTAGMLSSPTTFFLYVGSLSANLFMINILPIPPLDGYKFLENIIESIIRKELNQKYKIISYSIGAILFAGLFIIITIKDIFF